jgi:branched-chain amino acid transport system substrate-binding protein
MAGVLAARTVHLSINPKSLVTERALGYDRHMNIHRRSLCIFLVLLLILVRWVVPAYGEVPAAPSITIGAILPLTGSASNFGAIAQRGIELALEDLSPEDRARTRVIYEDDGLVNARSATAARKLLSIDKVDALITWSSGTALTVASILEASRVPQIAIASDPAVVRGKKFSFTYWPLPEDEARTLSEYLVRVGKRRVALLTLTHNGALAIRDAFTTVLAKEGGGTVVASEEVAGDVVDFRAVISRIKAKGEVDAFVPILFPGQLAVSIKQARDAGITASLVGFETLEDRDEFTASGGLMVGAVYATGADPEATFVERYSKRFPGKSLYTANQTYDALRLFVAATRSAKDGATIAEFLRTRKDYPTASGPATSTGDNRFKLPTTLKRLDGAGNPEVVRE